MLFSTYLFHLCRGVHQSARQNNNLGTDPVTPEPGMSAVRVRAWRLMPVFLFALAIAMPSSAFAGDCGGPGQRACCNGDFEFSNNSGACNSGSVYVSGCNDPNGCSCSGGLIKSENSLGMCYTPTACGGPGQRACCNGLGEFSNNGLACNSGLIQLNGACGSSGGGFCVCGAGGEFASGTCVQPNSACGGKGQRACCVGTLEYSNNSTICNSGLVAVPGCAGDCTCGGTTALGQIANQSCTTIENISEPSTNSTPAASESAAPWTLPQASAPSGPLCPANGLCGYADLHVHMWANLAHGGATLAGEPWDAKGVNTALGEDYGMDPALQNANGISGNLCKEGYSSGQPTGCTPQALVGVSGLTPACPDYLLNSPLGNLCATQQLFHGDHTLIDTITGGGTNDSSGNNFGAPSFTGWPQWTSTVHQQVYWKWLERAWLGGLRLMVMDAVTNEALCKSSTRMSGIDCSLSMPEIDLQLQAAKSFQTWLDGQYGGTGKGWFQIVTDPVQATSVIQQGKLAVVLGIEVDNLFNCHVQGANGPANGEGPVCNTAYITQQLTKYYGMGVRHIFPIHNFDNAFGAPAAWQDAINVGNYVSEGNFYTATDCSSQDYGFYLNPTQELLELTLGFNLPLLPVYQSPPWATCHSGPGLTSLGDTLIQQAMNMGMMIDVDHMSITSFNDTIALANQQTPKYGGIAATHVQFFDLYTKTYAGTSNGGRHERMRTATQLQSLKSLGGVIAVMLKDDVQDTSMGWCLPGVSLLTCAPSPLGPGPIGGQFTINYGGLTNDCMYSTKEWSQAYLYGVNAMGGPVGMGSDFNGIAGHVGPRFGSGACGGNWAERTLQEAANNRLVYPFTLPGFGTFDKQVSGQRAFDFNNDGLAHIGLLPDMVADLKNVGLTDQQLQPLFGGAQAYINSWSLVAHVPPQITSADTATFQAAVADTTFTVTATGNPAATLSASGALPGGVTFNPATGTFSGTPGSTTAGSYPLTITASNGILPNATQNFTLVVAPTPAFTNDASAIVTVGVNANVSFSSPFLTTLSLVGALPQGLTFNSAVASGTGTLTGVAAAGTGGVYPLTEETKLGIIVTNSQPFVLYVFEGPKITSASTLNASAGAAVSFQVVATGYPAPSFGYSGTLPHGVDFDYTTGRFFGTPQAAAGGVYPITIFALNSANLASQSFTLTVSAIPGFTSVNNATFTAGTNNGFNPTTIGYPTPQLGVSGVSPAAPWLGITLYGLVGNPPASAVGTYTMTLVAFNSGGTVFQPFTLYVKANPAITWNTPAPLQFGSALSASQLNATAAIAGIGTIPGNFTYSVPVGTVLPAGQNLISVTFIPTDTSRYFVATKEVYVTVNFAPKTPVQLITTQVLSRDSLHNVIATITIANTGGSTAQNIVLTSVKLGTVAGTITPPSVASIVSGATATFTATFPAGSVPASGTGSSLSIAGTYTGGTINSAGRIVLP